MLLAKNALEVVVIVPFREVCSLGNSGLLCV